MTAQMNPRPNKKINAPIPFNCGIVPTDGKARGLDALDVFETCVEAAAQYFAKQP
jgi:hypothetical protein